MAIPTPYLDFANGISQARGVPVPLTNFVIQQESGGNPNAVSHAGALGMMQLMPSTGAAFGLHGQDFFDPYKNMSAGVSLLAQLHHQFNGDPTAVLIGYNAGPRWAHRYQSGEIGFNQLPLETQNYVNSYYRSTGQQAPVSTPNVNFNMGAGVGMPNPVYNPLHVNNMGGGINGAGSGSNDIGAATSGGTAGSYAGLFPALFPGLFSPAG